ncbi:MAG: 1-acyl-sn-glycerol-3-phosphate acyltransferase [Candidatus Azobacteroides pseudotrichonymphae]|jgi:putative hemolysin|uniref:Phospholipid/glycerol acyltransferase domain-containing protein n=1 Tax=Azobacteroides pseudotrichonymphae genomovar. CFP2 TaxID=511995 RepID=B6YR91_AZOPC|nr:1-acyl-sn-glycerol-3-phosphate acyltransferase [Candidatus Azobacteroides pseudotrichonymphae]MDR0530086.1 1-acyl-sn-glycerol-3-phosphate acyltransferase [Bacteroidales bacterium OttesenSCG-928-I14]BAG83713.1 conserved hypothetical protein [Candidatus Azobacteroides pseudotrichonymphae genomovar. CFP2]GMO34793.1 MAG: 1-acyl-sn-glycerol-3-phosphate acyltransferase [Candidatus Azobacteroides pseudotrichonymphae]
MVEVFQIDVWEIFLRKFPDLYMKTPAFIIKWFARLVCQNQLNAYFRSNAYFTDIAFMENAVYNSRITLHLKGMENLPVDSKRCVFVSNHPLGGLDGICLSAILGRKYNGNIRYLVNDILYFIEPLRGIFIPINKYGTQTRNGVNKLNEAFDSDNQIITFPAGICSRKIKGKIRDIEWKKMFISKAIKYNRDVVPIYFEAANSCLFYIIAGIRRRLGIKFNVEMLLLPREMFKSLGSEFAIHFGQPIPWQTFDSSKTALQWANDVKNRVYAMQSY